MGENILEIGNKIEFMEKENMFGMMVDNMMVNMLWIKNKGMGNINGQMEDHIKDNGNKESNMEKAFLLEKMELKNKDYGNMEKELNGYNNY